MEKSGIVMKKLIYMPLLLCLILMAPACNDLLENVEPSTSINPGAALNNPGTIEAVKASMYDYFHDFTLSTRNFLGADALADNSFIRDGATRFFGLNNNRGTNAEEAGLNDLNTYEDIYSVIAIANSLIEGIPEGVLEEEVTNQYRAEALVIRAYAMHYLVRVLGYEPGMAPTSGPGAGFESGIIIRTDVVASPEDVEVLPRNTVTEVYTQIKSDLNEAISLLPDGVTSFNLVNKAFAQGLLARVHLYEREYESADAMAQAAIDASGLALVSDSATVASMFDETSANHPESILTIDTDPSTEGTEQGTDTNPTNNALNAYTANQWVAQLPTQSLIDTYDENDHRLGWYAPCFSEVDGQSPGGCNNANENGWEIQKWNAEQGQFADDYPLMRIAELKLIQAEARSQAGEGNVASGLQVLNELPAAGGVAPFAMSDLQLTPQQRNVNPGLDPFIAEVLTERRRELAFEGHRFFDLKRLGLNIPDPSGQEKINYNSYKMLDNIDPSEIETNEELEQNPGY